MGYELTTRRPDDFPAIAELDGASFGFQYIGRGPARRAARRRARPLPRRGATAAGSSARARTCRSTMTLPGGAVRVAGLTWVSVEVTHRRRGILRALMERQLRDRAARRLRRRDPDRERGRHLRPVRLRRRRPLPQRPSSSGAPRGSRDPVERPRRAPADRPRTARDAAARHLRPVAPADARAASTAHRTRWQLHLLDRDYQRHGMSGLFHLVHADGYVSYRMHRGLERRRRGTPCRGRRLRAVHARGARRAVAGAARHGPGARGSRAADPARRPAAAPAGRPAAGRARSRSPTGCGSARWTSPRCCPRARYAVEVDVVARGARSRCSATAVPAARRPGRCRVRAHRRVAGRRR